MADPLQPVGGLVALFGSLAPKGAIFKRSAADPKLFEKEGRAVVFTSLEDLSARIDDPALDVTPDDFLVLQNAGPLSPSGMPEAGYLPIPQKLARAGVKDMVRISDARMSGTAYGSIVLHVTPDAASGGPLAKVRNGDRIRLSVEKRRIDLLVSDEELARRPVTPAAGARARLRQALPQPGPASRPRLRFRFPAQAPAGHRGGLKGASPIRRLVRLAPPSCGGAELPPHRGKESPAPMSAAPEPTQRLPLAGITVLDFGQIYQGPYATAAAGASAGADVIKIEPPHGEPLRRRAAPAQARDAAVRDAELQQAGDHAQSEDPNAAASCCSRWCAAPTCCWRISRPARWTISASARTC